MATSSYLEDFRALARAAARGVAHALRDAPGDPATARLALERVGDLMRCDTAVPSELAAWSAQASEDILDGVVRDAEAEARDWPLPEGWTALGASDDDADLGSLAHVLQRRDEIESLCDAVVRAMLVRGRSPAALGGWTGLEAILREVDGRLAAVVSRPLTEHLLGARVCLVRDRGWVSCLRDEGGENTLNLSGGHGGAPLPADVGEPSDAIVFDYLTRGRLYRYVEAYAAQNPAFAEELAGAYDTLQEEGELGQALIPRRWRKDYAGGRGSAVTYGLGPVRLAAAADDSNSSATIELGTLPGLQAEVDAELELSAGMWTLHVVVAHDAGPRGLKAVRLNDVEQTQPDGDGAWRVRAPHSAELELRVEDATGAVFIERLRISMLGS
jgi:hypothetical protein